MKTHARRSGRRLRGAGVAAVLLMWVTVPVHAQTSDEAAQQAAAEIAAARDRANAAAEAYFEAESQLGFLELDRQQLATDVSNLETAVEELEAAVAQVAVERFVSSGSTGIPLLTDVRAPTAQMHGDVLAAVAAESSAVTVDDYDAALDALADKRAELVDAEAALEQHKLDLLDLQKDAEAEVERLRDIEDERLADEAVQAALAAMQLEQARQYEELQRRQAEAARTNDAVTAVASDGNPAVMTGLVQGITTGNQGASGGAAGGRTGGGGFGNDPRLGGNGFTDSIICPVVGSSAYGDTWGAPRSGGRRHQGVDMLAPTGTPLQAVVSGSVTQGSNRLGGVTLSLFGDNGNRYYYAHLAAYEGLSGRVEQAQVIGYVGDSGNAIGTPHLHFEIRPGGGVPVNPYPSVLAAGC
ncbi:MAG TPA: peptidoglycan DD-metalloendopeptidase family protein [Ilumatobacter sp.]|nr:peptidoglycan DD-metalloendopeptidase family protein [Ilumatobacter sp.]